MNCDFCDLALRRQHASHEGQTLVAVAVGDRHARHENRFTDGPVNVFLDGKRVARYEPLPRSCAC